MNYYLIVAADVRFAKKLTVEVPFIVSAYPPANLQPCVPAPSPSHHHHHRRHHRRHRHHDNDHNHDHDHHLAMHTNTITITITTSHHSTSITAMPITFVGLMQHCCSTQKAVQPPTQVYGMLLVILGCHAVVLLSKF